MQRHLDPWHRPVIIRRHEPFHLKLHENRENLDFHSLDMGTPLDMVMMPMSPFLEVHTWSKDVPVVAEPLTLAHRMMGMDNYQMMVRRRQRKEILEVEEVRTLVPMAVAVVTPFLGKRMNPEILVKMMSGHRMDNNLTLIQRDRRRRPCLVVVQDLKTPTVELIYFSSFMGGHEKVLWVEDQWTCQFSMEIF